MTINGKHTVAETRELLEEKDSEIRQLDVSIQKFLPKWTEDDLDAAATFESDWKIFLAKWRPFVIHMRERLNAISAGALNVDSTDFLSAAINPGGAVAEIAKRSATASEESISESEFQEILHTLQKTPGFFQRGDLADFLDRLSKAGADFNIKVRQPRTRDVDLERFKSVDATIRGGEDTAKLILTGVAIGVGGLLAFRILKNQLL